MLNIQTQCCGMLLLWIITYFFCGLKRVEVKTQRTFLYMLVMMNVCVAADILSVCAICYEDRLPAWLVGLICKFYLLMLMAVCFCGLLYICADVYVNDARRRRVTRPFYIGILAFDAAVLIAPVWYTFEGRGEIVYSYGPSVIVAYIAAVLILLCMIAQLVLGYKKINPRRRLAVILWLSIWILAALVQYFNQRLLIVSFAGIVGVTIIYVMIENPEANIERRTGFFNLSALSQYLSECYANDRACTILNIASDEKIEQLSKRIREAVIFVGGGEVFLVFQEEHADVSAALKILKDSTTEETIYSIPDIFIADSAEELLSLLTMARKLPKKEQKSRVFIINQKFMDLLAERKQIEKLIQEAIEHDRVEVFYQPIYSTVEKQFCSAEALVRIKDESGEIISPGVFIPVAENNGAIIELGKIVIDKVCHFLSMYESEEMGLRYVEVNLSVVQGEDENLARDIIQIIDRHGVSSRCVNLEITESASIRGKEQLLENMNVLIEKGIDFSLDDFGTGQSNLDYMADMPVKLVKFDRKMTNGYFESEKVKHIMNAAIQMIHGMGMEIVAEGIETKEQLECMVEQGIEYIQGFYFSKPIPQEEFKIFMKQNNR